MKNRKIEIGLVAALSSLVATPGCIDKFSPSPTCYDPYIEELSFDYICSHCGNTIKGKHGYWTIHNINTIEDLVKGIKKLGYDAILDKTEFCPYCSKKTIENPELIFQIRFSDEDDYHTVRSNIANEYQCLFDFLSKPDEYAGNREIIQKMTGLGEDLKIGK